MEIAARCAGNLGEVAVYNLDAPHSNFAFIDNWLLNAGIEYDCASLRRVFSLSRTLEAKTLTIEKIESQGSLADEESQLQKWLPDYVMLGCYRFCFWSGIFVSWADAKNQGTYGYPLGYTLLKLDRWKDGCKEQVRSHVFESVFQKYPHSNNCIAFPRLFDFCVGDLSFEVEGTLYCQQGPCLKSCAHVALRSLIMTLTNQTDVSYSEINQVAGVNPTVGEDSPGLKGHQIVEVLRYFGIECDSLEYDKQLDETADLACKLLLRHISRAGGVVEYAVIRN